MVDTSRDPSDTRRDDLTSRTTFSRDGLVFNVRESGPQEGTPVVLLHGFPESSESWRDVMPALNEAGYRAVAPDQRGYSPRARPAKRSAYVRRELVADVIALADQLRLERFHLVGHDWGAAVAWAVAIDHPDRVRTLTSLSIPHPAAFRRAVFTSPQFLRSWYMGFFQLPRLPETLLTTRNWRDFRRNLLRSGLPASFADVYVQRMQEPGALTAAINWYRGMRLGDGRPLQVRVPTLLIWSTKDAYVDRRGVQLTQRYVTAPYRLEVLDGVSHWIPEEAPDRVVELMLPHLASA
jgi:pimeloyl-ACP methyl ester carboxylesterase